MGKNKVDLERLFEANAKKLYNFYYFKTLNKQQAEDLTSETFLALTKAVEKVPPDQKQAVKYLYGIARNTWNQHLRKKYKNMEIAVEEIEDFSQFVEESYKEIQGLTLQERAMKYINQLPTKQYDVALLRLVKGYSTTEIAEKLSVERNTIKVRLRRAMRSLEKLVELDGVNAAEKEGN